MATWASLTKGTKAQKERLRAALHAAKKRRLQRPPPPPPPEP